MQFPLLLREALPYLQEYSGKTFLIKTGGKVFEDMDFEQLVHDLVTLRLLGIRFVLVLGSGPQFDRTLEQEKISYTKINGRRVTTPPMVKILTQILDKQLAHITRMFDGDNIEIVNISALLHAEQFSEVDFPTEHLTGSVTGAESAAIQTLLDSPKIPVCFSLIDGYNCNADDVSLALAKVLQVEKVVFLTGAKGVFLQEVDRSVSELLSSATPDEVEFYIQNGKISGGMIPKALAAAAVVRAGVPKAHIVSGLLNGALLKEIFTHHGTGTMIANSILPDEK